MARKRHTPEEIIGKLCAVEVELASDELLNREIFYLLKEAHVLIEA